MLSSIIINAWCGMMSNIYFIFYDGFLEFIYSIFWGILQSGFLGALF
jgi:hypothetical protein